MSEVNDLHTSKLRAWEAMKDFADRAERGEEMSAEDAAAWDRAHEDYKRFDADIKKINDTRAIPRPEVDEIIRPDVTEDGQKVNEREDVLRGLIEGRYSSLVLTPGGMRAANKHTGTGAEVRMEKRDITTGSTGAPTPTNFYDRLVEHMIYTGPMLDEANVTMWRTTDGNNIQIPRTNAWSTAAIGSEGTAPSESDPTFQAFTTLGAFKYNILFQVSTEMLRDDGTNSLEGYFARQAGNALGTAVNAALTTGTGTVEPWGIFTRSTNGKTGGTGVSGQPTFDNIIDVRYSVNSAYTRMPGCAWQANNTTTAVVRKLKDDYGQYLWTPALQSDRHDQVLGFDWYENPDAPNCATDTKSIIFGHIPDYFVRVVNGIRFERSDDFAFNADLVTFRAIIEVDGDLPQTGAVKAFTGGTA